MGVVLWEDSKTTKIGDDISPVAINNEGQVTGYTDEFLRHSFIWEDGSLIKHLCRTATEGQVGHPNMAHSINDNGVIVGTAENNTEMFVWRDGKVSTSSITTYTVPKDINNNGQIAGSLSNRAAIWEDGEPTILPDLM